MRKSKKLVALALSAVMVIGSLAACGSSDSDKKTDNSDKNNDNNNSNNEASYDEVSEQLYNENLGEFYKLYTQAKKAETISERFALMAISEAKFLESAVMLPTTTLGGRYAISRTVPNSKSTILWGNDNYRTHNLLVTTELIKEADRAEMKAKWQEVKGSGEYDTWVKQYLKDKGYTLKDTYNYIYTEDPVTWDVLSTSLQSDSEPIIQTYDGLMEYDDENELKPALAESYTVSEDGLKYTFKLRAGLKWVDSQGREVADVKADDFVAGMQHMMDAAGGLEYLVQGVIVNADEYINHKVTDFKEVGVKAVDDLTVEYTLIEPNDFFLTMLGYGIFAPMSRTYYESQGGKFGSEFDSSAADYNYGKTQDNIAYCGPYLVTNATEKNTIVFKANESYWNKDNVNIKTLTWLYNDGSDATKAYNDTISNVVDGCSLTTSAIEVAKKEGVFDTYSYVSDTDSTTYSVLANINRQSYANSNDSKTVVSKQTDEQKKLASAALKNVHFRRAVAFAIDRGSYNAQGVGEDIKLLSLRNTYTPGNFVQLAEDVTIDINGKATEFKAGTNYGEIVQAQLDADGVKIKAWDKTADEGAGSSDGFEGWYNPQNAVEELNAALTELEKDGIKVDENNPVVLDMPYASNAEVYVNRANAIKKSVEDALGGKVKVNLVECKDTSEWLYAGYHAKTGEEANYDLYDCTGWSPDYGDPASYLDTFLPDYAGCVTKNIGIY